MTPDQRKNENRERTRTNRDPIKERSNKLFAAYGITAAQYDEWNDAFGGVCHICEKGCPTKRRLATDHNHVTELVRGLLCINCNKGLGNFKDSIDLLKKAIAYLEFAQETQEHVDAVNQVQQQEGVPEERGDRDER
jgi:Autographiviridae endonuclease VII